MIKPNSLSEEEIWLRLEYGVDEIGRAYRWGSCCLLESSGISTADRNDLHAVPCLTLKTVIDCLSIKILEIVGILEQELSVKKVW